MEPYEYTDSNVEQNKGQFTNQYPYPEVMVNQSSGNPYPPQIQPERQEKQKSGFVPGLLVGMAIAFLIVIAGWMLRTVVQMAFTAAPASATRKESVLNKQTSAKVQKIEKIIDELYYKDEDIDRQKMEDGMYAGLVDSLGDIYSVYYNAEELTELLDSTQGIYSGIGAYLSIDQATGCGVVAGTISGTPAEESLRSGDIVYKVDGESIQGLSLDEIVAKVRGEEGSTVHLTVVREGESDYLEIDLVRKKIESPTVEYEMMDNEIGYIQIKEFDDVTTDQFTDAYATIKGSNAKGLIIDLRGNPGGNVDTVVSIARQILPKGNVFYTENKYGEKTEYKCNGEHEIKIPLVVLVDAYSASASEILAGAVKDYGIGKLVGTTTFGKGIVQRVISLSDGTALKLTESAYYTPAGNNIHGIGIEPDVEIKYDSESYNKDGIDNQLEKGKEVLLEMMK